MSPADGRRPGSRRVRLAVRLLPATVRERYAEQWAADLRDAPEHGLSPGRIASGALRFAALSRLGPHGADPIELERQSWRLARWGGALVGAGAIGATAGYIGIAGGSGAGQVAAIHPALVAIAVLPIVLTVGAVVAGIALLVLSMLRRPRIQPGSVLIVLALCVGVALVATWPLTVFGSSGLVQLAAPAGAMLLTVGAVAALIVWGLAPHSVRPTRPTTAAPRWSSATVLVVGAVILLLSVAFGVVEGLVWGPIDQTRGAFELGELYRLLGPYDRVSGIVAVVLWAALWALVPPALAIVRHRMLRTGSRDVDVARLLRVLLLLAIGGAVFFQGWATFGIGMSIGDSLPPYVGSRSAAWFLYSSAGISVGLVGVVLALAPGLLPSAEDRSARAVRPA